MKTLKRLPLIIAVIMILSLCSALFSVNIFAEEATASTVYEAEFNGTNYTTLKEALDKAIEASQNNSAQQVTVNLLKDITSTSTTPLTLGTNGGAFFDVTINGNGYTVNNTCSGNSATFYVWMGKLTLNDMTINSTCNGGFGALVCRDASGSNSTPTNKAEIVVNNVNLNVKSTTQQLNDVYINNNGKITFTGINVISSNTPKTVFLNNSNISFAEGSATIVSAPSGKLGFTTIPSGLTHIVSSSDPFDKTAKIGNTYYSTLESATAAAITYSQKNAAKEVTVELLANTTIASAAGMSLGTQNGPNFNLVIDGNGYTVSNTLSVTTHGIGTFYAKCGTTTIKDITINSTNNSASQAYGAVISRYEGTKVILEDVNINVDGSGGLATALVNGATAYLEFRGTNTIVSNFKAVNITAGNVTIAENSKTTIKSPSLGSISESEQIIFTENSAPFPNVSVEMGNETKKYVTLEEAVNAAVKYSQENSAAEVIVSLLNNVVVDGNGITLGAQNGPAFNVVVDGDGYTITNTLNAGANCATFYNMCGVLTLKDMTINVICASQKAFGAIISRYATSVKVIVEDVNINVDGTTGAGSGIFLNEYACIEFNGTNVIRSNFKAVTGAGTATVKKGTTTIFAPDCMTVTGANFYKTSSPFEDYQVAIGETPYTSLPKAFEEAVNGDVITLLKDINNTTTTRINCYINGNINVTLDGNGKTITNKANVVLAFFNNVSGVGSVTVKDLTLISDDSTELGTVLQVNANTKVTLDGCKLDTLHKNTFGAVYMKPNSHLVVTGGTVIAPTANGAAIHFEANAQNITIEIDKANISANYLVCSAGANTKVTIGAGADITVNDGVISGSNLSVLNISGGTLTSTEEDKALITVANADAKVNVFGGTYAGGNAIWENTATSAKMPYDEGSTTKTILPEMVRGASARLVTGSAGIRFRTTISADLVDYVNGIKDEGTEVIYGTLIAPASYIVKAGIFTKTALENCSSIVGAKYQNILATEKGMTVNADGSITLNAALVDIKTGNYQREFAATGYICYTINGETQYVYTDYSAEDNARSIYGVACAALADKSDTQEDRYVYPITKYLVKNEDDSYSYVEGNAFSKYDTNQIKLLDNYFNLVANHEEKPYEPQAEALNSLMQSMFEGNTVKNETVMFLDYCDEKTLLYPIETVISVTSYDGSIVYVEGTDYSVVGGKIKILEGSSIPCITREKYYNTNDATLTTNYNGQTVNTHWGEGQPMTGYQVNVNYTHTEEWDGYVQACESDIYASFIKKLEAGEDVTILFYGDSITRGASASWEKDQAPYQYQYSILFTQALADLYGYRINYVLSSETPAGKAISRVPSEDYVAGYRGTITYINTAIGGWTSQDGIDNVDNHVKKYAQNYGCDLFICAFGMNDGSIDANTTAANVKAIVNTLYSVNSNASVMIVSTMVPNPNSSKWYGNQQYQEEKLLALAEEFRDGGKKCAVACMTSMSLSVLDHKEFNDYSGNNINHPNDFFIRVYAQTLLQTLVGYNNLK